MKALEYAEHFYIENLAKKCYKQLIDNMVETQQERNAERYYQKRCKSLIFQEWHKFAEQERSAGSLIVKMNMFKHKALSS